MKTLIQLVMVSLLVGGISAGGSFYWHSLVAKAAAQAAAEKKAEEEAAAVEVDPDEALVAEVDKALSSEPDAEAPEELEKPTDTPLAELRTVPDVPSPAAGIRPPYDRHADEAGQLINKLRDRALVTTRRERRSIEREELMDLVARDLRTEQIKAARVRQKYDEEYKIVMRAAEEEQRSVGLERASIYRASESDRTRLQEQQAEERRAMEEQIDTLRRQKEEAEAAVESARTALKNEQEEIKKQEEEAAKSATPVDDSGTPEQNTNVKNLTPVMESMPVENAAKVLQDFVEKGRTEAVVVILNGMKPKKAANILAVIQDTQPELVSDLLDRLKRYQKNKPAVGAPAR